MVQHMEVSTEDASLHRSQQLRELYDSLSAGEASQAARRPCAALSPEDLTESEWFYLMCISFSFPPGVGLPGKAFAKQRHVWLVHANEADSKYFSRAILAKSAQVQTVVCIPVMDGVLELGNTEKVEEDAGLVKHAMSFFMDFPDIRTKTATLSEHSTSSSVAYMGQSLFQPQTSIQKMSKEVVRVDEEEEDDDEHDDDDEDEEEEDEVDVEASSKSELQARTYSIDIPLATEKTLPAVEASELMPVDMSEGIRIGSPDDCSNELDLELEMFAACQENNGLNENRQTEQDAYQAWNLIHDDICKTLEQPTGNEVQDLSPEDTHYSETVSSILKYNMNRWTGSSCFSSLAYDSKKSAFLEWRRPETEYRFPAIRHENSQWLIKRILVNLPNFHSKYNTESSPKSRDGGAKFRKGNAQEEPSANHVLAERRRREKLNERFIILRSLVPFVTKMDKASILGDTIEYVKQLRKHIQELEARNKEIESKAQEIDMRQANSISSRTGNQKKLGLSEKKKMKLDIDGSKIGGKNVQVSIIEADALLELQCQYKEGLLLKIMQTLDELRLEVTSIQSTTVNGTFAAELRAKVKEAQRKKVSIVQVKKAIHQII